MIATLDISVERVAQSRLPETDFNNLGFGKYFSDHMLVIDYVDGAWQEPKIMPYGPLSFNPSLIALHYGQAIFEGMKAYRTATGEVQIFRPWENAKRLNRSAVRMCMPEIPEELFMQGLTTLLQIDDAWVPTQDGSTLYIRPYMFGTDEILGVRPSDTYKFIIFTSPVGSYYTAPVKVKIETHFTRAVEGGIGSAKAAGNYAASLYPFKLAKEEGYDQIIWTDGKEHKHIEESGTMNLMFAIGNKIITATLGDSVLDGITRKSVLQLAREWGYEVEERKVSVLEIVEALEAGKLTEAFGVGTAATIAPIAAIGYAGKNYEVPTFREDGFALRVKKYLIDLCKGTETDTFDWIFQVPKA
ncbi:MAG: branched-chain amino acid aminotransferase [Bacteroidetes bacterium]|nr:MAG: branched-chain amino acid aminotransferase [Bacteroidota bacterium]